MSAIAPRRLKSRHLNYRSFPVPEKNKNGHTDNTRPSCGRATYPVAGALLVAVVAGAVVLVDVRVDAGARLVQADLDKQKVVSRLSAPAGLAVSRAASGRGGLGRGHTHEVLPARRAVFDEPLGVVERPAKERTGR